MIVVNCTQRSPEWYAARLGKLTASCVADIFAELKKGGEAASRRDLRTRLVVERLTGQPAEDDYTNAHMQRGIDKESDALAAYQIKTGALVMPVGFVQHDELAAGASPDGEVDDFAGLLEVKCPKSSTHLGYLRSGVVPSGYLPQIRHALWITGAAWCDFVSFDDRFPEHLRLFVKRVSRADVDLDAHELAVRLFLSEVQAEIDGLAGVAA